MNSLRITLTDELQQVFSLLQINYPTLSKAEIAKLALGELQKQSIQEEDSKSLAQLYSQARQNSSLEDNEVMQIGIDSIAEIRGKND